MSYCFLTYNSINVTQKHELTEKQTFYINFISYV